MCKASCAQIVRISTYPDSSHHEVPPGGDYLIQFSSADCLLRHIPIQNEQGYELEVRDESILVQNIQTSGFLGIPVSTFGCFRWVYVHFRVERLGAPPFQYIRFETAHPLAGSTLEVLNLYADDDTPIIASLGTTATINNNILTVSFDENSTNIAIVSYVVDEYTVDVIFEFKG